MNNEKSKAENENKKIVSREERRWPTSVPAKKGALKGHCDNND